MATSMTTPITSLATAGGRLPSLLPKKVPGLKIMPGFQTGVRKDLLPRGDGLVLSSLGQMGACRSEGTSRERVEGAPMTGPWIKG